MAETTIEWADFTFNPWTGCTKVSPGCDHCYAEGWAKRSGHVQWGPHAARRRTAAATWQAPLKWNLAAAQAGRRARVFCASLADVFDNHPSILSEWRADLWALIAATPNLDWLLLTKRVHHIEMRLPLMWRDGWPNVWLGTTVENQTEANRRIPYLLATPARVRFLSCEPLLGPVDLDMILTPEMGIHALSGIFSDGCGPSGFSEGPGIDWVICGGESGPGARPMHPDWARSLRDQCARDNVFSSDSVPFFFKQWGEWAPVELTEDAAYPLEGCSDPAAHDGRQDCQFLVDGRWVEWPLVETFPTIGARKVGKKNAGRLLDGREWNDVPITKGPCDEEQSE
jgi:protein gp37